MSFRLKSFEGIGGLKVIRDGAFVTTGKLSTPLDSLCVPLRSARYVEATNANKNVSAVITTAEIADAVDHGFALGVAEDPDAVHAEIHALCARAKDELLRNRPNRIDSSAEIDKSAQLACYGVEIGARVFIGANSVIAPGVTIENDSAIHNGVTIGGPGFNTAIIGGRRRIVPQLGGVYIGPFVEILANCCIARAIFGGDTSLGEETIVDNLAYIAHDVRIGKRVQICALANILGRAIVGDNAYIGPSSVIKNGLKIGASARISIGSVVTQDVAAGVTVTGNFAVPHERFLDHIRLIR